jgi:hypothetical protein
VEEADAEGLRVDAVGADPTWSTTDQGATALLLGAVAAVQAQLPVGALDGVLFDVEPWGLPGWRRHASARALDWLTFVQAAVADWNLDGLSGRLGFTVPYWFDGDFGAVPEVSMGQVSGFPFQLSLGLLSGLPDTVLDVMAYRNTPEGSNGSLALFGGDQRAAQAVGAHTRLLFGQETGRARPKSVSFYGLGCARFDAALAQIAGATAGVPTDAGVAVDDVESLLALCPA